MEGGRDGVLTVEWDEGILSEARRVVAEGGVLTEGDRGAVVCWVGEAHDGDGCEGADWAGGGALGRAYAGVLDGDAFPGNEAGGGGGAVGACCEGGAAFALFLGVGLGGWGVDCWLKEGDGLVGFLGSEGGGHVLVVHGAAENFGERD